MKRRGVLEISEDVYRLLLKESELSVHAISQKVKCEWKTAVKILEFLGKVGVVKEKRFSTGEKRYERLFELTKD